MEDLRLVLFPLGDGGDEEVRLAGALAAARTLGAHLRVMHTVLEPNALLPKDVAVPRAVLAGLDQAFAQHADRDNVRLRTLFARLCADRGVDLTVPGESAGPSSASWFEARGVRSALVARHGKLADWVLVSQPADGRATASLQAAVLQSGRPVLMLPRELDALDLRTVVVAWNGSPQAVRSLAAAGALLRRAGRALVVATRDVEARGPTVDEVAAHLAAHDVAVEPRVLDAGDAHAGTALLDCAAEADATALVMGAYGTRKVRDLVLGTVTAQVIADATVPVLMAS